MPTLSDIRADAFPTLVQAWRWWTGELAQLLPGRMAWDISRKPRADIRPSREGVEIVRIANGEGERLTEAVALTDFDEENWRELAALLDGHRVRLILTPPLVHVLTLRLPRAARPYLRTAIPLQLAEHAPLPLARIDWTTLDTRLEGERLSVRIAMARRDVFDAIEAGFREHDIALPYILAEADDSKTVSLRRGQAGAFHLSRPWAWTLAILAATPIILLLLLYILVLKERDRTADLEDLARPRLAAERHIREQAEVARGLNHLLGAPAVTSLVEGLADRLPPSAHATDLSMRDDGTLEIGLSTTDMQAARNALLGDPHLVGVRQIGGAQAPGGTSGVRFEARPR